MGTPKVRGIPTENYWNYDGKLRVKWGEDLSLRKGKRVYLWRSEKPEGRLSLLTRK